MKTLLTICGTTLVFLTLTCLVSPSSAQAQASEQEAGSTVAKGSVGESGATSLLLHKVQGKQQKLMVLRNVQSSLCGNTGVVAMLVVNGEPKVHGAITDLKSSIQVKAKPGDHVVVVVHAIPLFNGVACVRLGEARFELAECDVAK